MSDDHLDGPTDGPTNGPTNGPTDGSPDDLAPAIVGLVRTLRAAGVDASHDRLHAFMDALRQLGATDRGHVYWAGRLTLCADPDDLERYDRVFLAFFEGTSPQARARESRDVRLHVAAISPTAAPGAADDDEDTTLRTTTREASATERLRHRDIAELDARERLELDRLLQAFTLPGETRRTRRRDIAPRGVIDRRRTVRAMLRAGGEPGRLAYETPRSRPRRVVLLVDVSGSMAGYADALLRFAHAASRRRAGDTEVFTLGTRLTRVTEELTHRDADTAMRAVSAAIPDWEGGTRLAETLRAFLDRFGQRGLARGAVAVVLSDGWETGDVPALGEQMARLQRLAHRVIWANPRAGRPGFEPTAGGMRASLPHCDQLVEGNTLGALEHLARTVAGAAGGRSDDHSRRERARRLAAMSAAGMAGGELTHGVP